MPKTVVTNDKFWDCECEENFIHSKEKGNYCTKCETYSEDQPDSIQTEITYLYDPSNDSAIKK